MNTILRLLNNRGKPWVKIEESYIKGFAFKDNILLDEEQIYNNLRLSIDENKIDNLLLKLNGNFSAVISYEGFLFLIADKIKSYPLLYKKVNDYYIISDQAREMISSHLLNTINESAISTYLASGYLHGNQTFLSDCKIISAGSYLKIENGKEININYHQFIYPKVNYTDDKIMEHCINSLENSIKRTIVSVKNRPIWIPLSGGYDSRLLACVCKKLNIQNVSCYTYGTINSNEVKISKEVATRLGFPWHFIEYNREKILSNFSNQQFIDYIFYAMNLNTTSHYQDFIAFKELVQKGLIQKNAVIIPGHSGEILGRDQVPYEILKSKTTVAELIYHRYFQWNILKKKHKKRVLQDIGEHLNEIYSNKDISLAIDLFTNWNIQNRQANYIINSVRIYEYFNIDWRLPLWDDELAKNWFELTWLKNSKVELYNKFMFQNYFKPFQVEFYKNINSFDKKLAKIRLPFGLKSEIKTRLANLPFFKSKYDSNGFNALIPYFVNQLSDNVLDYIKVIKKDPNALFAQYQVYLLNCFIENQNNEKK